MPADAVASVFICCLPPIFAKHAARCYDMLPELHVAMRAITRWRDDARYMPICLAPLDVVYDMPHYAAILSPLQDKLRAECYHAITDAAAARCCLIFRFYFAARLMSCCHEAPLSLLASLATLRYSAS